jgi:DNA-binding LytR/AlgR family response regulator
MKDVPSKVKIDLLFLDIEMPGNNGVHVGEYIRNEIKNEFMHIIYVSSKTNYAMELFKVHPYDFIVKPIDREKIISNVTKLLELDEHDNRYFSYEYNRVKNKIHYGDIVYFESDRKHIKIICSDGTKKEFVGKISEIVEVLPFSFALVAQSFVINLRHISLCKKDSCIMDNGDCINIGRKHKDTFSIKMIEYNKWEGNE